MFNAFKVGLVFVIVCLFTSFSMANASSIPTLTIYTEEMPPYNFSDRSGNIKGINVDIVKTLLERANINYKIEIYPWARTYKNALEQPNSGVVSTARTDHREPLFKWVGPLASSKGYIYKLANRKDIVIKSIEDVKRYNLAIVRNDIYQEMFRKMGFTEGKNLTVFPYSKDYYRLFLQSKVDLIIGSDIVVPFMLANLNQAPDIVESVFKIDDMQGNFLALNLNVPDDVVERLNNELIKLKNAKEYNQIIRKYTESAQHQEAFHQE